MIYVKADEEMVEVVEEMLQEFHPHLDGAKIAVICRDTAQKSKGKTVLGTASRPPKRLEPLLDDSYHFVITLAMDQWDNMTEKQKRAVVDHELCHCRFNAETGEPELVPHDLEEFGVIIARHGLWRGDDGENMIQGALLRQGFTVKAVEVDEAAAQTG